jgi:hypothetical protein
MTHRAFPVVASSCFVDASAKDIRSHTSFVLEFGIHKDARQWQTILLPTDTYFGSYAEPRERPLLHPQLPPHLRPPQHLGRTTRAPLRPLLQTLHRDVVRHFPALGHDNPKAVQALRDLVDPAMPPKLRQSAGGGEVDGISINRDGVLDTTRICDAHPTLLARHRDMVAFSPFVRLLR